MTIAVCGSITFHKQMRLVQRELERLGHDVLVPKSLSLIEEKGFQKPRTVAERLLAEEKYQFLSEHFEKIRKADAILVVNPEKHGVKGYIGGNTFLEMGVAYYLQKLIYLLHPIPELDYTLEIAAMRPMILDGDLTKLRAV